MILTEREWVLSDFGATPIVIDRRPILDWVDWASIIETARYTTLASYRCVYSPTLVREFFANRSSSSIGQGEEHILSMVRGCRVHITPDWLATHLRITRPLEATPEIDATDIFADTLRTDAIPRLTPHQKQIPVGFVRPYYIPCVRSVLMTFR